MIIDSNSELKLDNPFWQYSLQCWQRQEVQALLMAAQQQGIAINLVLFAAWCTEQQTHISQWQHQQWHAWHQSHTVALRQQRYALAKSGSTAALYKHIAAAELAAEQIEQALLFEQAKAFARNETNKAQLFEHNLDTLLTKVNLRSSTNLQQQMRQLGVLLKFSEP